MYRIRRRFDERLLRRSFARSRKSNNPELHCVLPLDNEFDLAGLEDLEGLKVENILPQKIASSSPLVSGGIAPA